MRRARLLWSPEATSSRTRPVRLHPVRHACARSGKFVSVVLVEVIGFDSLSELADPEDRRAALQPFQEAARREITYSAEPARARRRCSDGGVRSARLHEDDPRRAVGTALAIRRWIREEGSGLQVRIAVNTGVALVTVDSGRRAGEPVIAGEVVSVAQRIPAEAPVDGIGVGERDLPCDAENVEYREVVAANAEERTRFWCGRC